MTDSDTEINLDEITDEALLQNLLDQTEDIDDRKAIRARIQELHATQKGKREDKLTKLTNTREEMLQKKKREAEEHKQRTLAMYDQMARSSPAGSHKAIDIGLYKSLDGTPPSSGSSTPTGTVSGVRRDATEDIIRQRQKEAEDRKKRILAAYDSAARSAPAGAPKEVDFESFRSVDVSDYQLPKSEGIGTFAMSGGVPKVAKGSSQPGTPSSPGFPGGIKFPTSPEVDVAERQIRARQQEADERKRRTLAAYDIIAKQGAGPKIVCLEEFRELQVPEQTKLGTNYTASASFSGGVPASKEIGQRC